MAVDCPRPGPVRGLCVSVSTDYSWKGHAVDMNRAFRVDVPRPERGDCADTEAFVHEGVRRVPSKNR